MLKLLRYYLSSISMFEIKNYREGKYIELYIEIDNMQHIYRNQPTELFENKEEY